MIYIVLERLQPVSDGGARLLACSSLVTSHPGLSDTGFIQSPRTNSIVQWGWFVPATCT